MKNIAIPRGWVSTEISSFCDVVLGQSPPSSTYNEDGEGLPFYQGKAEFGDLYPAPQKWCSAPKKIAEPNSVLVSVRAPVGPTNICTERSCIGRGLAALHCLGGISHKFVLYLIRAHESALAAQGTGSTFDAISGGVVGSLRVPVPPLPEQRRIVERIEELLTQLDAGVAELRKAQAQLKRYRQAVLRAAITGELTREWREEHKNELEHASELLSRILNERRAKWESIQIAKMRSSGKRPISDVWKSSYREPTEPKTNTLVLPSNWVYASAEQLTSVITDGEHVTPERADTGVLLLSARNVRDGALSLDKVDYIPEAVYRNLAKRLTIEPGDVLLSCSGTVGRSCVAPTNMRFALVRSVAVLKPLFEMGRFLSYALRSPQLQAQIQEKKTQTAQANIFQGKISKLLFPLPSLLEQKRIVEELERLMSIADNAERTIEANLRLADCLRQSVKKQAFEGKLVAQDPKDEPAEVLLERIRVERQKREAEKKTVAETRRKRLVKNRSKRTERPAV